MTEEMTREITGELTATSLSVVVFDVNETLSDMSPMADEFLEVGAPGYLARTWFASLLRDGFALAAAGHAESFATIAKEMLRTILAGQQLDRAIDDAVGHIMAGFLRLPVHPDVPDGIRTLHRAGPRLVTLTNGSTTVPEQLLDRAGLADQFSRFLSVEDAGAWKPVRAAYEYAAEVCGTPLERMLLVAAHPWDIDGAARAGMRTAWINRSGAMYPGYFTEPDLTVAGVDQLAARLSG